MQESRFRQIHMDFHNHGDIPQIGAQFDAEEFAAVLDRARVNSVTCFARGHHGYLYYDSTLFPERIHPHLANKDLLKQQIEACHARGIKVPIYITVQWDLYTANRHPEWRVLGPDGTLAGTPPYKDGFYQDLCVNTPYRDFLKAQTKEVLEIFPTDGLFFDIVNTKDCSCYYCKNEMISQALDPSKKEDRLRYATRMIDQFKLDMTEFIRQVNSSCRIFYNCGHIGPYIRRSQSAYSHFELESLPSGHWGYTHFPLTMRYARNLEMDCVGVTGKFHTEWGDFHSFKNQAALEYECFRMLALNAKCMIGDQLHPNGKISQPVYDLIGSVYKEVEKKEPWCTEATSVSEIGVFTPERIGEKKIPFPLIGAIRMLEQTGYEIDVLDEKSDLTNYKLLIMPDTIPISRALECKLEEYLANGGKLIASGLAGFTGDGSFMEHNFGVKLSDSPTLAEDGKPAGGRTDLGFCYADYIMPEGQIGKGLSNTEHVMHMKAVEVEAQSGSDVLAHVATSFFDRNWRHFCSHRQTPSSGNTSYPGIVRKGNCIYFAHPIFSQYSNNAPKWCRQLVVNAMEILMPDRLIEHDGPTTLLATVNEQVKHNRWVLHLLHYIPERRSETIDIIEDVIPIFDTKISLRVSRKVKEVRCVPQSESLPFALTNGRVEFTVSRVKGHQMLCIGFE